MPWYDYLMWIFGGAYLAKAVPHFTQGISGHRYASPPERNPASPRANVMRGMANFVVGYVLLRYSNFTLLSWLPVILSSAGVLAVGLWLARPPAAQPAAEGQSGNGTRLEKAAVPPGP